MPFLFIILFSPKCFMFKISSQLHIDFLPVVRTFFNCTELLCEIQFLFEIFVFL